MSRAFWASSFIVRGALDDRDPGASLDRQEGEIVEQVADTTRGAGVARITDHDLTAGSRDGQPVEVGVVAARDQAATTTLTAGAPLRVGRA